MAEMNENKRSKNVNLKARKEGWKDQTHRATNKTEKTMKTKECLIEIEHSTGKLSPLNS